MTREDFKTYQNVFDKTTLKSLWKLSNSGYISVMYGRIAEGKESHVFYAENEREEPVAVKIFLVEASDFKTMNKYIRGDPRFHGLRRKKRGLVHMWTRKEYQNLLRAHEKGVKVPIPHSFKNNVLVMEFIGSKGIPAPTAKGAPPRRISYWCKALKESINNLWNNAKLVHADLSEFNILNHNDEPVIIDWSSAVVQQHPLSHEFLSDDIKNSFKWLKKAGANPGIEKDFYKKVVGSVQ